MDPVNTVLAAGYVIAFGLGLLAMQPLDRYIQRRQMRGSLSPARRKLIEPNPKVNCSLCHKDVSPSTARYDFSRGWQCKSHRLPQPIRFQVAA